MTMEPLINPMIIKRGAIARFQRCALQNIVYVPKFGEDVHLIDIYLYQTETQKHHSNRRILQMH